MDVEFCWDEEKAHSNFKKHGVRFAEAVTVWLDERALEISDPHHSESEERWVRLGFSRSAQMLVVVFVENVESQVIRIISARKATQREEEQYRARW